MVKRWDETRWGLARLRENLFPVVQTAGAAALPWLLASVLLGHSSPVFAPIAAIVALGATRGQRARQAIELMLGVALGDHRRSIETSAGPSTGSSATWTCSPAAHHARSVSTIRSRPNCRLRSADLAYAADALAARIGAVEEHPEVSSPALKAVAAATELAPTGQNTSSSVLVAYTQATAADLLRALGIDRDPAHELVVEAAEKAFSRSLPIARSRATTAVSPRPSR